jgi:hypothetical protein
VANKCSACAPETTAAFCARFGRNCGPFTNTNLCGGKRSVNCGGCVNPESCGGGGKAGVCGVGCIPENDAAMCSRLGLGCGNYTGQDNCSQTRSVNCGGCLPAQFCDVDYQCIYPDGGLPGQDAATPGLDATPAGLDATNPLLPDIGTPDVSYPPEPDTGAWIQGDGGTCASESSKAQQSPLDIFIMLDQSGSMLSCADGTTNCTTVAQTKWGTVTSAIEAFVNQSLTDVSVGIQYFAIPPAAGQCTKITCKKAADCGAAACGPCTAGYCLGYTGGGGDSCDATDYSKADVEIALLPGVGSKINASISSHSPASLSSSWGTGTPTYPALQGAVNHAKAWAQSHQGHVVIDILATDGEPEECDPTDIPSIAAVAAAGVSGSPKILTFVIGIDDGSGNLGDLNHLAQSGGTDCATGSCTNSSTCTGSNCYCDSSGKNSACIVTLGGTVTAQMLAALNAIRGSALGCTYKIPASQSDGGMLDLSKVNVQYTPSGGSPVIIGNVSDSSQCPTSGTADDWYYDTSVGVPTSIILCASTCTKIMADKGAQVDILVGCQTKPPCTPTHCN